jgi:hypothetical protein
MSAKLFLGEFKQEQKKLIEEFYYHWRRKNESDQVNFPIEMNAGDWDEQFAMFQATRGVEQ